MEGIVPDVDQVIEALLTMDLTAGTVLQVTGEGELGQEGTGDQDNVCVGGLINDEHRRHPKEVQCKWRRI